MQTRGLTESAKILAYREGTWRDTVDDLAAEEPLEIRLIAGGVMQRAGVTMRTPGNDFELAAGFLLGEGVLAQRSDIAEITYCVDPEIDPEQQYNIVNVSLTKGLPENVYALERHFTAGSACGVCGKASIEALQFRAKAIDDDLHAPIDLVQSLPDRMRSSQRVFKSTGGLHAAALFDKNGTLLVLREDVGRHNALDKAIGWALLNDRIPLQECIALVSGRASYELLQKCIVARAAMLCAVSAPSSLAVQLAREFNLTLIGFLREGRANVYAAPGRVATGD